MGEGLSMSQWLQAVDAHGIEAREHLLAVGVHPKVIEAKAEKAAHNDYAEYGVVVDRQWLTDKGRRWLAEHKDSRPSTLGRLNL